jgi:LPS-assembly lipoprotein
VALFSAVTILRKLYFLEQGKIIIKKLIASLSCLALLSCGFHLRGLSSMPFESIHISTNDPLVFLDIKRRIQASSKAIVLDNPMDSDATLHILSAKKKKVILSVSGTGRVREFQLRYSISFKVTDKKGRELVPISKIVTKRVLPFSDSAFLSSQGEEKTLLKEMKKDTILKMMDRLGKINSLN